MSAHFADLKNSVIGAPTVVAATSTTSTAGTFVDVSGVGPQLVNAIIQVGTPNASANFVVTPSVWQSTTSSGAGSAQITDVSVTTMAGTAASTQIVIWQGVSRYQAVNLGFAGSTITSVPVAVMVLANGRLTGAGGGVGGWTSS